MSTVDQSIPQPDEFNMSHIRREKFCPMVAAAPPGCGQDGTPIALPDGHSRNYYPWGVESAQPVAGPGEPDQGYLVSYLFPVDDQVYLMAYCLDTWLDPVWTLMSGRDFGTEITTLVARHWPRTFQMLCNGLDMMGTPGIIHLRTADRQWAVGCLFADTSTGPELAIPAHIAGQLFDSAMAALGDVLGWPNNLPGLLETLGDDLLARRLKGISRIVTGVAGLGG